MRFFRRRDSPRGQSVVPASNLVNQCFLQGYSSSAAPSRLHCPRPLALPETFAGRAE